MPSRTRFSSQYTSSSPCNHAQRRYTSGLRRGGALTNLEELVKYHGDSDMTWVPLSAFPTRHTVAETPHAQRPDAPEKRPGGAVATAGPPSPPPDVAGAARRRPRAPPRPLSGRQDAQGPLVATGTPMADRPGVLGGDRPAIRRRLCGRMPVATAITARKDQTAY